ncbi:hypothetical protein [Amycolatopsis sp. NPDC059657]|uniref:hypothetical protein n=1 Tax=Amycolatopsis sp. NPDC059657 TaxID=3346899 RepID=UPI00366ED94B
MCVAFPSSHPVLAAHGTRLGRQAPTTDRYLTTALITDHMATKPTERCGYTTEERDEIVRRYLAVLNRQDWCDAVHANPGRNDEFMSWFVDTVAARLHLRVQPALSHTSESGIRVAGENALTASAKPGRQVRVPLEASRGAGATGHQG